MSLRLKRLLPLACLLCLLAPVAGQSSGGKLRLLFEQRGTSGSQLGSPAAYAGDVNGDGVADVVATSRIEDRTYLYSGIDGSMIRSHSTPNVPWAAATAGDINGDGYDDVMVGTWFPDRTLVFSGADGSLLITLSGGLAVASLGDLDGDGVPDLVTSSSTNLIAQVWSGATATAIWTVPVPHWYNAVAGPGDLNGDGVNDVLVGRAGHEPNGVYASGSVQAYSGADGGLLWNIDGGKPGGLFGQDLAGVGDVDGDQCADVIIGSPFESWGSSPGEARVYSGATGSRIRVFHGDGRGSEFGYSVDGAGDVDGDGVPDFVIGAPRQAWGGRGLCGAVYLYSGATGAQIEKAIAHDKKYLGFSVSGMGDLNQDGLDDIVASGPMRSWRSGAVFAFGLDPFLHPSASKLSASSGLPVYLDIDFPAREAGASYLVLASTTGRGPATLGGIQVPLSLWSPLPQRMLSGWDPPVLLNGRGTLDSDGDAVATLLSAPGLAPYAGRELHLAVVSYDALSSTGRRSSVARSLLIAP